MTGKETKICEYCGKEIPITATKCKYCFNWVPDEVISRNHIPNNFTPEKPIYDNLDSEKEDSTKDFQGSIKHEENEIEYNHALPIRRLLLLMFFTLGLYTIYWFYNNSKILKEEYDKDINISVRTILFAIIPFANWIVFYFLLNDWEELIRSRGIESFSAPLNLIIYICLPFFGLWTIINVQESINDFWRIEDLNLRTRRRCTTNEIIVMVIFSIIWILIIFCFFISITALV